MDLGLRTKDLNRVIPYSTAENKIFSRKHKRFAATGLNHELFYAMKQPTHVRPRLASQNSKNLRITAIRTAISLIVFQIQRP